MDLSELGLSEDQLKGVEDYAAGLKAKNDELLGEKKAEQRKAVEANEATEAARLKAVEAEEARLKLAGDVDGLKAHYESQLAEKVAEANQSAEAARGALTERDKGAVISDILSSVDPRYKAFVETQLNNSVSIDYVDGKPVTSIKDGDAQYASSADFLDGVKESDSWKHVLTATSLSGANTQQSTSTNVSSENTVQSNLAARLKAQGLT